MNFFAKWNSLWPFTVNVSGKKAKLINSIGKIVAPRADRVNPFGILISTKNHACASIIRYAPYNFFYDFHKSNLGIFMTLECQENDVFVDVGANLGGYSFMAKRLGLNVYAFEPFPEIAAFLMENNSAYGHVFPIALSNESSVLTFHISDDNIGGSSLVASNLNDNESGYTRRTQVQVNRGDVVLREVEHIRLLKIDVEGNEENTIKGFQGLLEQNKIQSIWCEVRGPKSDRNPNSYLAVTSYLEQFGFTPMVYSHSGRMSLQQLVEKGELPQYFDLLYEQINNRE
jgi:FkbM family methyltransferase